MSQENKNEMRSEVDFSDGVRGKYLARYQRWAGITTATGPIQIDRPSTGEPSAVKIVLLTSHHGFQTTSPGAADHRAGGF
jgi:hypothetical protein